MYSAAHAASSAQRAPREGLLAEAAAARGGDRQEGRPPLLPAFGLPLLLASWGHVWALGIKPVAPMAPQA